MPPLNYAILSLGAFHPVRPESFLPQRFKKETYGKENKKKKIVSILVSLLSFQEKPLRLRGKKPVGVKLTTVVCHPGAVVSNAAKSQL